MSDARKTRTSAKSWLTRASKKLQSLCEAEEHDLHAIMDAMEEFEKRL